MGLFDDIYNQGTSPPNPDASFGQLLSSPLAQGLLATVAGAAASYGRGRGLLGNLGNGALTGLNAYTGANENAAKSKYMDAQMANLSSEVESRKAALAKQQQIMALLTGEGAPTVASYPQGQLGSGSFGAVAPAPGVPAIGSPTATMGGSGAGSSRVGSLTPDRLAALKANGLDLVDVYKLTQPDMQVNNGYAYDRRNVQPGFLPQLNVSQNGQTSMVRIGPDGLPVVSAPRGALDTFAGYQNVQEGTKANYDPVTVTPQGENPQMTTRGALVRNPAVSGVRVAPQEQAARDQERMGILQQEVTKAQAQLNDALSKGDQSAAARAQADLAALNREMGGRRPTVGMPLQSEEEKLRATEGVKSDAKRNEDQAGAGQKSKDTLGNIAEARRLLRQNPTHSGVGTAVDSVASFFGKSAPGADVASQLNTLSGWMVSNVPRMEGPQSNFDVQNYKTMAGLVGDSSKPISQRLKALDTLETLQSKYAHLNGGGNNYAGSGATGSWSGTPPPKPMIGMVRSGYRFKGGDPAKQESWEKQ
jgi:hypothetical protein